jgi:cell shape-determining protein MreC
MKNFSSKTKGNYLLNSNSKRIRTHILWIVCAFIILFGAKEILGALSALFTTPIFHIRHYVENSSGAVPVFIQDRLTLLTRIHELEEKNNSNNDNEALLQYLTEENTELRELGSATNTSRIIAGVIGRPPHTPYDTLVIDQGSDDGILQFAPVYQGSGTALGYVRTVYGDTSLVTLFSSPGVETTVFVFGPNLFTTAYGEGGGVIRLSIPQGITVEKGDVVILPSLDTGVVGSIHDLISIPTEPEQKAFVSSEMSLQSLRLVSVGRTPVRPIAFDEAMDVIREEEKKLFTFEVPVDVRMEMSTTSTSSLPLTSGTTSVGSSTPR